MQAKPNAAKTNNTTLSLDDIGIPSDKPPFLVPFFELKEDRAHLHSVYQRTRDESYQIRLSLISELMDHKSPTDLSSKYGLPLNVLLSWCMAWNFGGYLGLEKLAIPKQATLDMLPPQRKLYRGLKQDILLGGDVPRIVELRDVKRLQARLLRNKKR